MGSPLRPLYTQLNSIKKDAPFSDIYVSQNKSSIFFIGKTYLWQWQPQKQRVFRLKIGKGPQKRALLHFSNQLWTHTEESLVGINVDSFKPTFYRLSKIAPLRFLGASKGLLIILGNQAFARSDQDLKTFSITKHDKINFYDFKLTESSLWWFQKGLYVADLDLYDQKKILDCHEKENLKTLNDKAWYQCGSRIFLFSDDGRLLQIIPEKSEAEVLDFEISENAHSYLFSNGILEVYDTDKQLLQSHHVALPSKSLNRFYITPSLFIGLDQSGPFLLPISSE